MSATTDKTDGTPQAATAQPPKPEAADGKGQPAGQRQQVQVDDTRAVSSYANFCRVTGTPEERGLDGLGWFVVMDTELCRRVLMSGVLAR